MTRSRRISIFTYHRVTAELASAVGRGEFTVKSFRRQLQFLQDLGWESVSLDEVLAFVEGDPRIALPGRTYVLSFDDGYRELLDQVVPLLERAKIKAIFFVPSALAVIERSHHCHLELLRPDELQDLVRRGFEVGCHSATHPRLTEIGQAALERETSGARKALSEMCGAAVKHFCYPYGAYDWRSREAVIRAGFRSACTTQRGRARLGTDPYALPRINAGKPGIFRFARRALFG